MDRKMYILNGKNAKEMPEHRYEEEADLQELIANNPNLVARAWGGQEHQIYLICREMISQASEDEGNSFSLDHLLVDDEGVPILVEVKRSTDTRIRREVVAQMMDYACRASSWNVESLKELFLANNHLSDEDHFSFDEAFWSKVESNLRAERLRLVFAADDIPDTLRILIEFMDRSMEHIEVYGVEIRQFKTDDMENAVMLSSNIVGNSLNDPRKPSSALKAPARTWTRSEFLGLLEERGLSELENLADDLMDFVIERCGAQWVSGVGTQYPALHAKRNGTRFLSIEISSRGYTGNYCAINFNTVGLPSILGDAWSADRIRKTVLSFSAAPWAKERNYIWGDSAKNKWLYVDLRALRDPACVEAFKNAVLLLANEMDKN